MGGEKETHEWVDVGAESDFPEGRGVEVTVGARRIGIFRSEGKLYALKNICPHRGDPLHRLPIRDGQVMCIGHGWRFDLESGHCTRGEDWARVASYPVEVRDGRVFVDVG